MLTSKMCLDFNQFTSSTVTAGFFHNRGPQLQQHSDRLMKDNLAPDPDLLCYTVVSTLYVKVEIYLGSQLH
jgi:hypothetical protein